MRIRRIGMSHIKELKAVIFLEMYQIISIPFLYEMCYALYVHIIHKLEELYIHQPKTNNLS